MKTKHIIITIVAILIIVISFNLVLNRQNSIKEPHLNKMSLRLQWLHQAQFAGFYVAKDKGYYAQFGIDLTINSGGQDFNAATLVGTKSDDFGIWTADQVLLAASNGVPIQAVGAVFYKSLAVFMVHADSKIKTPKDFECSTVGMYYGYDTETIYKALIDKFYVDKTKIKETALQYDLQRFFNRDVDVWPAYIINQPIIAEQKGCPVRLLHPEDFDIRYYSDTIIVNKDTANNSPNLVINFLAASEMGWQYALKHPEEATQIVLKYATSSDPEFQQKMLTSTFNYLTTKGGMFEMSIETWESIKSLLEQYVKPINKLSISDTVRFDFAGKAHEKYIQNNSVD